MNRTPLIVFGAVVLIAMSLPLSSNPSVEDASARKKQSYQEQFLRALKEGPLVNSTPCQYLSESILIPKAHAEEMRLEGLSVKKALAYLEQGAEAWNTTAKCVTCHTNGSYMAYRPALTSNTVTRNFEEFVAYLDRTGVQRGIINSQRSQLKGTPAEFIAGNREVAR